MTRRFYPFLNRIPIANKRLRMIENHLLLYYPDDKKKASYKAAVLCFKTGLVYLLGGIYFLFTQKISFSELFLAFCTLKMAGRYVFLKNMNKERQTLYKGLDEFIKELRFQFSCCRRMDDALEETIDRQEGMLYLHGRRLLTAIQNEEPEEDYIHQIPSRFLALLYILCKNITEYGDQEADGASVCLSSLSVIREGIQIELLNRTQKEHLFSGLLFTCMIPLIFVKLIEIWAISNMEELKVYYQGGYGMITTMLLGILSLLCYSLIQHWQYDFIQLWPDREWLYRLSRFPLFDRILSRQINRNYKKSLQKHRTLKECGITENLKQYLLLQYLTALCIFFLLLAGLFQYQSISRAQIVLKAEHMLQNLYQLPDEAKNRIFSVIEDVITGQKALSEKELELSRCPENLQKAVTTEIRQREQQWKNWHYPWPVWLLPFTGAAAAYFLRYRLLLCRKQDTGLKRKEEILTFQAIILFLMHIEHMDSEKILYWLEKPAFYFKDSIADALYCLVYQNYEEAELLIEKEASTPLSMILGSIMACDRLPIEEAFGQMEADYHYSIDQYRKESERYIKDQGAVGRVLAFVPLYMTVGFKLIVPFVLEGLSQLSVYSESMKQFM